MSEQEFVPTDSATTYGDVSVGSFNLQRFKTAGDSGFIAAVHLPGGAVLMSIEFDFCDSSTTNQHWVAAVLSSAKLDGLYAEVGAQMASVSNSGTPCAAFTQDLTPYNYVVDNTANRVALFAIPSALNNTNTLVGAVVGYRLQVSPPPATATFNDVPTTHPFFQFIEALHASGITGGCQSSPPMYCPDNFVTRGQMAVFLAKALGLNFP